MNALDALLEAYPRADIRVSRAGGRTTVTLYVVETEPLSIAYQQMGGPRSTERTIDNATGPTFTDALAALCVKQREAAATRLADATRIHDALGGER